MEVFTQIQQFLDANEDEHLIKFCVGRDSELSKEISKTTIGKKHQQPKMSEI